VADTVADRLQIKYLQRVI